jgi:hypothetical protein
MCTVKSLPTSDVSKAPRSFETSVAVYQSTRHNTPEDLNLQQYRCENLKSHCFWVVSLKHRIARHYSFCMYIRTCESLLGELMSLIEMFCPFVTYYVNGKSSFMYTQSTLSMFVCYATAWHCWCMELSVSRVSTLPYSAIVTGAKCKLFSLWCGSWELLKDMIVVCFNHLKH